jgi:dethiobiotin synthetase
MRIFVAGTDTGVGKTFIAARLISEIREAGHSCVGFKPVACGDRDDAEALWQAGDRSVDLDRINPVWLKTPASPFLASQLENASPIRLQALTTAYEWLADRFEHIVVEGAGGWLTPLAPGLTMASLATELALPVVLVSANRLGTLNHTLLTVAAIQAAKIQVRAIILNKTTSDSDVVSETNCEVLREFVQPIETFEVGWRSMGLPRGILCLWGLHSVK